MVVWWGTPVEAHSAFARLVRDGELTAAERTAAVRRLTQLRLSWNEILPSEQVRSKAEELFDDYPLRAADALQVAAALVWCRERPRRRPFVCFDERLVKVATAVGFTVES
jgi:predicted nucleic acid-binding protein